MIGAPGMVELMNYIIVHSVNMISIDRFGSKIGDVFLQNGTPKSPKLQSLLDFVFLFLAGGKSGGGGVPVNIRGFLWFLATGISRGIL